MTETIENLSYKKGALFTALPDDTDETTYLNYAFIEAFKKTYPHVKIKLALSPMGRIPSLIFGQEVIWELCSKTFKKSITVEKTAEAAFVLKAIKLMQLDQIAEELIEEFKETVVFDGTNTLRFGGIFIIRTVSADEFKPMLGFKIRYTQTAEYE